MDTAGAGSFCRRMVFGAAEKPETDCSRLGYSSVVFPPGDTPPREGIDCWLASLEISPRWIFLILRVPFRTFKDQASLSAMTPNTKCGARNLQVRHVDEIHRVEKSPPVPRLEGQPAVVALESQSSYERHKIRAVHFEFFQKRLLFWRSRLSPGPATCSSFLSDVRLNKKGSQPRKMTGGGSGFSLHSDKTILPIVYAGYVHKLRKWPCCCSRLDCPAGQCKGYRPSSPHQNRRSLLKIAYHLALAHDIKDHIQKRR